MILGIHGSVRTGMDQAVTQAHEAGVNVVQVLPYRRHHEGEDLEVLKSSGLRLIAHCRFVPSLASSDEGRRKRSVELLAMELGMAKTMGAESYVLHAGAYSDGGTAEQGLKLAAESTLHCPPRSG